MFTNMGFCLNEQLTGKISEQWQVTSMRLQIQTAQQCKNSRNTDYKQSATFKGTNQMSGKIRNNNEHPFDKHIRKATNISSSKNAFDFLYADPNLVNHFSCFSMSAWETLRWTFAKASSKSHTATGSFEISSLDVLASYDKKDKDLIRRKRLKHLNWFAIPMSTRNIL